MKKDPKVFIHCSDTKRNEIKHSFLFNATQVLKRA